MPGTCAVAQGRYTLAQPVAESPNQLQSARLPHVLGKLRVGDLHSLQQRLLGQQQLALVAQRQLLVAKQFLLRTGGARGISSRRRHEGG